MQIDYGATTPFVHRSFFFFFWLLLSKLCCALFFFFFTSALTSFVESLSYNCVLQPACLRPTAKVRLPLTWILSPPVAPFSLAMSFMRLHSPLLYYFACFEILRLYDMMKDMKKMMIEYGAFTAVENNVAVREHIKRVINAQSTLRSLFLCVFSLFLKSYPNP